MRKSKRSANNFAIAKISTSSSKKFNNKKVAKVVPKKRKKKDGGDNSTTFTRETEPSSSTFVSTNNEVDQQQQPKEEENLDEGFYFVEKIVEHKIASNINFRDCNQVWTSGENELAFLVKWKNYDELHNTWEPLENLMICGVFEKYLNNHLVPTIGYLLDGEVCYTFVEPIESECYYLKKLYEPPEAAVEENNENEDVTVAEETFDTDFIPSPPKKRKQKQGSRPLKPKKPKIDAETKAANRALENMLNGNGYGSNKGNEDANDTTTTNSLPNDEEDFFGGAVCPEDMIPENDIYEADVILGDVTFNSPQFFKNKKKNPPLPKKKTTTTKSCHQQKKNMKAKKIEAQPTPQRITRSMAKYSNDTSLAPLDSTTNKVPFSSAAINAEGYDNLHLEEYFEEVYGVAPENDASESGTNYLQTYDCLDGTELTTGQLYMNGDGTYLIYDGQYLTSVDPSEIVYTGDEEAADPGVLQYSLIPSNTSNQKDSQVVVHEDDPMLMGPQASGGDFSVSNTFEPAKIKHQSDQENAESDNPQSENLEVELFRRFPLNPIIDESIASNFNPFQEFFGQGDVNGLLDQSSLIEELMVEV